MPPDPPSHLAGKGWGEGARLELVRNHLPPLRAEGLVTDRAPILMRTADGTVVEIFEWVSQEAIAGAHGNQVRGIQADPDMARDQPVQALRRFGIRTDGADALEAPPLVETADERIQDGLFGRERPV